MTHSKARRIAWWIPGSVVALWLVVGFWIVPGLIAKAHAGGFFRGMLPGRETIPLATYLATWTVLWWRLSAGLLAGAVMIAGLTRYRSTLSRSLALAPTATAKETLWFGAWFGFLSAGLEVTHVSVRHLIERHPARGFTPETIWMGPWAGVAAFLAAGLVFLLGVRLLLFRAPFPDRISMRGPIFLFAGLAAYGVLESPRVRLAPYATFILSAGLATGIVRGAIRNPSGFRTLVRRTTPWAASLLVVLAAWGVWSLPSAKESRRLATLPVSSAERPNILLLILDTVRATNLGVYGYRRPTTPHLEQWADSGVVFEWTLAPSSWTLPSHATMFTGHHPHELSTDHAVPLDETFPTLAEVFTDRGYSTAAFVSNYAYTTEASGLQRGFARYEDYPITWGRFLFSAWLSRAVAARLLPISRAPWRLGRKTARANTDDFLRWLTDHAHARPFFVFLNYIDAHYTYSAPRAFRRRFPSAQPRLSEADNFPGVTPIDADGSRAAYDAAIAYLDAEIHRLLTELANRGILNRTVVVITSDHGEQFGEHGLLFHGKGLYLSALHIPLILVSPGLIPSGLRITTPVSPRDLPATLTALAFDEPASVFPGRSFGRFWDPTGHPLPDADTVGLLSELTAGGGLIKPWDPVSRGSMASVLIGTEHVIRNGDGRLEWYDVSSDPWELHDLNPGRPDGRLETLERVLDSMTTIGEHTSGTRRQ